MTKFYNVTLRCPEKKLPTLMGVVSGEMTLVSALPEGEEPNKKKQNGILQSDKPRYAGGKRNKGISGEALALETIGKGPTSRKALQEVFVERGFAANSSAGYTSTLMHAGKIELTKDHKWVLSKKK